MTFATATPFQEAMAVAMETAAGNGYYDQFACEYAHRRELMRAAIENVGLQTLPVSGSYFLMADFSGLDFASDIEFCKFLVSDVGVATVPPSVFYSDPARRRSWRVSVSPKRTRQSPSPPNGSSPAAQRSASKDRPGGAT